MFIGDIGLSEDQLSGKLLLDAGCGNGTMTAALATFGLEVVGMDLNDGLGKAYRYRSHIAGERSHHVHYVQASLLSPPLRAGAFDVVYCSGVIHHTANSESTFGRLAPLVKSGGRLYVWVYGRRSAPVRAFFAAGRELKNYMSLESLLLVCRVLAPFYRCVAAALNRAGVSSFRKRTSREVTLDLFDAFAPDYNHCHSEDEVRAWFKRSGFTNIEISGRQKHGFGVRGDKR